MTLDENCTQAEYAVLVAALLALDTADQPVPEGRGEGGAVARERSAGVTGHPRVLTDAPLERRTEAAAARESQTADTAEPAEQAKPADQARPAPSAFPRRNWVTRW